MKLSGVIRRVLAFGVILSVAGLAALGLYAFRNDLEALRRSTKENILWSAAQLEFELARFTGALAEFAAGAPGTDARAVNNRFDVLWSRAMTFKSGEAGARLSAYDVESRAVEALFADIEAAEPAIVGLTPGDREAALRLVPVFQRHAEALRKLTFDVLHGEESKAAQMRDNVRQSAQMTAILSAAAVVLSILALGMLTAENRRFRRLADSNLRLAEEADKANRAKSRFLTMMSHELRTPMNGVLGLLALAKQSGLPRPQLRLVEQAEKSGHAMIAMLSDMLDFSALQDDRLTLERHAFSPRELGDAVQDMFGPVARREGVALSVTTAPGMPANVMGDFGRLRQALSHLAAYVVETAGARGIELRLSHDGTDLVATLSFAYGDGGPAWKPELILGAPERSDNQFASDALGPAVARLLIGRMGGSIRLDTDGAERIEVMVRTPAEVVAQGAFAVRIEARSAAMAYVFRAALQPEAPLFQDGDAQGPVHAVILETGGALSPEAEAAEVRALRGRFPGAAIIAVGQPLNPALYDGVAGLPLDAALLRRLVFRLRLAS